MHATTDYIAMVVDDDSFQRRTVARILRSAGVGEVLEATDGKHALQTIHQSPSINLVICDLDMPEMDGMELIRHLGHCKSTVSLIISSAKPLVLLKSVEKMAKAYGVSIVGVIPKPMTLASIKQIIAELAVAKPVEQNLLCEAIFTLDDVLSGIARKEFEPFFQPKIKFTTRQVVGAEALARWHHPTRGVVGPYSFIGLLEQGQLIDELTFMMIEKAACACRRWHEQGFPITVSVNLSLVSLTDTTLVDRITKIVQGAGLSPHFMILEITETAAMTEVAIALEILVRLRMRGFGLSVDDFGTGFSSLQQLTKVPFTELKIDQSFVSNCAQSTTLHHIVMSSVEMARALELTSVAEGVESEADWQALQAMGCDVAQGYFIAKPMNEDSFIAFLKVPW